jgi:DUF1016 N-terminal domain
MHGFAGPTGSTKQTPIHPKPTCCFVSWARRKNSRAARVIDVTEAWILSKKRSLQPPVGTMDLEAPTAAEVRVCVDTVAGSDNQRVVNAVDRDLVYEYLLPGSPCPWFHIVTLITKLRDSALRELYAREALAQSWSRETLDLQIKDRLHLRKGAAVTNFARRFPRNAAGLANQILKDPYHFDFLGLGEEAHERDIEGALMRHITHLCWSSDFDSL